MLVYIVFMFNILALLMELLPNYPTIPKPNCMKFHELTMAEFAEALRPDKFPVCTLRCGNLRTHSSLLILKYLGLVMANLKEQYQMKMFFRNPILSLLDAF
jgi:hypothetical protein